MSEEIREAASRLLHLKGGYCLPYEGGDLHNKYVTTEGDQKKLAEYVLAGLAEREAATNERRLPLSGDWLLSIGFELSGHSDMPLVIRSRHHAVEIIGGKVFLRGLNSKNPPFVIGMCATTNRGMMLDFLAGLLIRISTVKTQ